MIRLVTSLTLVVLILGTSPLAIAGEKQQKTRDSIDAMAKETLQKLLKEDAHAKELYDKSYGYAVFNNLKTSLLLATARGKGVAIRKESGDKTYMKMGSLGINIGLGVQKMQVVFLFQTQAAYDSFVNMGWQADTSADAAVADKGVTVAVEFRDGIAAYEFTDKGLMLQANLSGTKYYKADKLNKRKKDD